MRKIIFFLLITFNYLLANTCVKMLDMIDDTKYARLEMSFCEDWININIKELDDSGYGSSPYINILEKQTIENLINALKKSLFLYEKSKLDSLSIKKSFDIFLEDRKFICVHFNSMEEIVNVKIEIISNQNVNFFTIENKEKLVELIEKIENIQNNGQKKLNQIIESLY